MTSVAILGAGAVGVACAGPLLQLGLAARLTLYDRDGATIRSVRGSAAIASNHPC